MQPKIVKMTWFHPKMPFPQRVRLSFGSLSPSEFGDKISSLADLGCLTRILDPGSECFPSRNQDPGSKFFPSWIPDPRFEFFHPGAWITDAHKKKWFLSSQKYDPGFPSRIRIPDLDPDFLPIPDPYPGSQIPNPGAAVLRTHSMDQLSEAFMCKKEFSVYFILTPSL